MSNNIFNNNNKNLKANNIKINNKGKNDKIIAYTIIFIIAIILLVGLLFLFGLRIKKCADKSIEINNNIDNNQNYISHIINKKNNEVQEDKLLNINSTPTRVLDGVIIPHEEGLEERMNNPHLYKHGNPFQYKKKVKNYYNDYN